MVARVRIAYYVVRHGRGYWQPKKPMRDAGFACIACGPDGPKAWAKATECNEAWQQYRKGQDQDRARIWPRASIGEAWERFRRTDVWAKKAARTREDWDRAWKWIEPVFADVSPRTVTLEHIAGLRSTVAARVSEREAHRVIKIWRAFWGVMAALNYCQRGADPSLGMQNPAARGRNAVWSEGEVVRLVKQAWRMDYKGLAALVAVAWDSQLAPVDARSLTLAQRRQDARGVWFDLQRAKTGREAIATLGRRSQRLLESYLEGLGATPTQDAPIFRHRRGKAYSKDTLGDDFRTVRAAVFPGDTRQLLDLRRSGAVEAAAGGADPLALSAKMANSIAQATELQRTYLPAQVATVREADDARRAGRIKLRAVGNKNGTKV